MTLTLEKAISDFGVLAKSKLTNIAASGEPEDQLRAPLENLILDLAELCNFDRKSVSAVGESRIAELNARPDYAVTVSNVQMGHIEVKAPGKGFDPRRFRSLHDKGQWEKLQYLPNLIYTDGNGFSLWRDGEFVDSVTLDGGITSAGASLSAPRTLLALIDNFLNWEPTQPRDAMQLAHISARLCRFLREEVAEQLANHSPLLTNLKASWSRMLFPDASDEMFADGYSQAVTFGLLVARAKNISLAPGLHQAARQLGVTNSLIGAALRILTEEVENEAALTTSIAAMSRVLEVVDWQSIAKGRDDTWLYFYEDFLAVYDNDLRKKTGSYYTPPEVVSSMVSLVDNVLRSPDRFDKSRGIAARDVTIADPAVGTGTFVLGVLRKIASIIENLIGAGAVPSEINEALNRIIAFEMQLGPFAVAQLRIFAEVVEMTHSAPTGDLNMFVTDTLGNPYAEIELLPNTYAPIAESRRKANEIKKNVPITVVIGNPPYKEKAKGLGGWVEKGGENTPALLKDWIPPADWGVSAHVKHLRNLYVYFWRWATWKVFDQRKDADTGIVCFITVAGFLNGPGFQKMRDYLRRKTDEIWVIDCSPEGHQPAVSSRIFQGVQQPVCIVLASRHKRDESTPAPVRYRSLPIADRQLKFDALSQIGIDSPGWIDCPTSWRSGFLPESTGAWSSFPALADLFNYNGSGVMPGRTWVIAPDADSLRKRWNALIHAPVSEKEELFHPHLNGDRTADKVVGQALGVHELREISVSQDSGTCISPMPYAFRSFDRQWIIPDARLINRPNPHLWNTHSNKQVYLTAPSDRSPENGPALTITSNIPDLHNYNGRGGRALPLFDDRAATRPNIRIDVLEVLSERLGIQITAQDLFAYIACVVANPAYTKRFKPDLIQPGLRIPLTADSGLFNEAVDLGSRVIWLHTHGERYISSEMGRPSGRPRLPADIAPRIPLEGSIPHAPGTLPDSMEYDAVRHRLVIGSGYIENVTASVWSYEVSGKNVLRQWFSYRRANRDRPVIGDRREPSKLGAIQPDHWLAEYTSDLIDLLNVLTMLTDLEPVQASVLEKICAGPLIATNDLPARQPENTTRKRGKSGSEQITFGDFD